MASSWLRQVRDGTGRRGRTGEQLDAGEVLPTRVVIGVATNYNLSWTRCIKGTVPLKIRYVFLFQSNSFGKKWSGVNFHVHK